MSIEISEEQVSILQQNGATREQVAKDVDMFRKQGMSDEDIQSSFDLRISELSKNKQYGVIETFVGGFQQGMSNVEIAKLNTQQMTGTISDKNLSRLKFLEAQPHENTEYPNIGLRAIGAVANQLPIMGSIGLKALGGTAVGAVAGSVIPVAGTASGALTGAKVATFLSTFELEAGLARSEMKQERDLEGNTLPEDLVNGASVMIGLANGTLEAVGFGAVAKTLGIDITKPVIKQAVKELVKDKAKSEIIKNIGKTYAKGVGIEVVTELAQEANNLIFDTLAKKISNQHFEGQSLGETFQRFANVGIDTALATGVIGGVGSTVRVANVMRKQNPKISEAKANEMAEDMSPLKQKQFLEDNIDLLEKDIEETASPLLKVVPKKGETRELTYFADTVVPEIGKKLGLKLTVTSRFATRNYASEHTKGIAGDVSTSEFNEADKIRIAKEVLDTPEVRFLSTSDPVLLKAFAGNPKIRNFKEVDKRLGTNHINHMHITVKNGGVKATNVVTTMPVADEQIVENEKETYNILDELNQKMVEQKQELKSELEKDALVDVEKINTEEEFSAQIDEKADDLLDEIQGDIPKSDRYYQKEDFNQAAGLLSTAIGKSPAWVKRFYGTDKFDKLFLDAKASDTLTAQGITNNTEFLKLGVFQVEEADALENLAQVMDVYKGFSKNADITVTSAEDFKINDIEFNNLMSKIPKMQTKAEKLTLWRAFYKWFDSVETLSEVKQSYANSFFNEWNKWNDVFVIKPPAKNEITSMIKSFKQGLREGSRITKKEIKDIQERVIDFIEASKIGKEEKGRFLRSVKNIQNVKQMEKVLPKIEAKIKDINERAYKQKVINDINGLLRAKATLTQGGVKKGVFSFEDTKIFQELKAINKMNKSEASDQLFLINLVNIDKVTFTDRLLNMMATYKANGMKTNIKLLENLRSDLALFKREAKNVKDEQELNKQLNKNELSNEVLLKVKDKKMTKIVQGYLKNFGSLVSFMREVVGDEFANKHQAITKEISMANAISMRFKETNKKAMELFGAKDNFALHKIYKEMKKPIDGAILKAEGEIIGENLNIMQVIDVYNSIKDAQTEENYIREYGINNLDNVVSMLTDEQKQFADYLMETAQSYYDMYNEYSIKKFGVELSRRSNYWMGTSEFLEDYNALSTFVPKSSTPSALKQKATIVKPIPTDAMLKLQKHVRHGEYLRNMAELHETLLGVFGSSQMQKALKNITNNNDLFNVINKKIKDISFLKIEQDTAGFVRAIEKVLGDWTAVAIASPSVFFKQLVSTINYTMVTPNWSSGFMEGILNPKKTVEFMLEELPYLRERFSQGQDDLLEWILKDIEDASVYRSNSLKALTWLTRKGDITAIVFGGYPYYKHLLSTMPKEKAVEEFIYQTEITQQGKTASNLSEIQKSRQLSFFMRFLNTPYQYLRIIVDSQLAYNRGEITRDKYLQTMGMYVVLQPILFSMVGVVYNEIKTLIKNTVSGDDDDRETDEKLVEWLLEMFNQMVFTFTQPMPVISGFIEKGVKEIENKVLEKFGYEKLNIYDTFDTKGIGDIEKSFGRMITGIKQENIASVLYNIAVLTAPWHKVPVATIVREADPWTGGELKKSVSNKKGKKFRL